MSMGPKKPGRVVSETRKRSKPKLTASQKLERVAVIARLLISGVGPSAIFRYVSDSTSWGVVDRTVERYMAEARDLLVKAAKEDIAYMRAVVLGRYHEIYQRAIKKGDLSNANKATQNVAKLLGLNAPDKITLQQDAEPVKVYLPDNGRDQTPEGD